MHAVVVQHPPLEVCERSIKIKTFYSFFSISWNAGVRVDLEFIAVLGGLACLIISSFHFLALNTVRLKSSNVHVSWVASVSAFNFLWNSVCLLMVRWACFVEGPALIVPLRTIASHRNQIFWELNDENWDVESAVEWTEDLSSAGCSRSLANVELKFLQLFSA